MNDSLALIIQIFYLKQKFFETDSFLLTLTTSTSHKQSYFKIDVISTKISNVYFLCLKARVFLVTIIKWHISGQGYIQMPGFQDSYCSNLQLVLCKRLTLSAASIFVTEGLFTYIFFLLFEENLQNRISRAGEKGLQRFRSFFVK